MGTSTNVCAVMILPLLSASSTFLAPKTCPADPTPSITSASTSLMSDCTTGFKGGFLRVTSTSTQLKAYHISSPQFPTSTTPNASGYYKTDRVDLFTSWTTKPVEHR